MSAATKEQQKMIVAENFDDYCAKKAQSPDEYMAFLANKTMRSLFAGVRHQSRAKYHSKHNILKKGKPCSPQK